MLTLSDYQKEALKTASEVNTLEYCVLGLVNEAGEVAGVVKKWLRGDYDEATMREKMGKELGDVLWYVAVTADRAGFGIGEIGIIQRDDVAEAGLLKADGFDGIRTVSRDSDLVNLCLALPRIDLGLEGGKLKAKESHPLWGLSEDQEMRSAFCSILVEVARIATLTGHTLESIARANIEKLRDRQKRGVLHGSGDER